MKVLITGFEAFGGEEINPALKAIKLLPQDLMGYEIIKAELPTVFNESIEVLKYHINKEHPNIVICVGQAGGRCDISIERVAINIDDASIPDNKGNQPIDQLIDPQGSSCYFSNLPIKAIVKEIRKNGVPASVSNTAGTFVCNHTMYGLLNYIEQYEALKIKGGFIHVPYIPVQVVGKRNTASMALDDIVLALKSAIEATIIYEKDLLIAEGKVC